MKKLITSAAQAAIFNAVHDARCEAGLSHTLRAGDLGMTDGGAPFLVSAEDSAETSERCQQGLVHTTGPLPGTWRLRPSETIFTEEQAWAAHVDIDWAWFEREQVFAAPGLRRPLRYYFLEAPQLERGTTLDGHMCSWLTMALPSGSYATEVLEACDVTVPDQRSGQ